MLAMGLCVDHPSYSLPATLTPIFADLRRCGGAAGYFIPLSGGIDSCATSVIVYSMCCRMILHSTFISC